MKNVSSIDKFLNDITLCNRSRCGFCKTGCATYAVSTLEPLSARGRNTLAMAIIDGVIEESDILVDKFLTCTLCGLCKEICPLQINTPEIVKTFRRHFIENGFHNLYVKKLVSNIKKYSNPYGEPREIRTMWARNLSFSKKSKTLFYSGCVYPYRYPEVLKSTVQIIHGTANVSMNFAEQEELCCGYPLFVAGYQEEFEEVVKENTKLFLKNSIETIITACPSCAETFSKYIEYNGQADFKVYHVVEYLSELIDNNGFDVEVTIDFPLKVTYHDPCHLARYKRVINEPRKIIRSIAGLEFREMRHAKFEAQCCGGGGGMLVVEPRLSMEVAKNRLKEAAETGADVIITACPTCKNMFDLAIKRGKDKLSTLDIFELLERAIKAGRRI